jgi:DNA-binding transcriptional LysR family regulator
MQSTFDDIEPFLRVAETMSFKRAALRLGVTPAAVSKAIQRLERKAGGPLFSRSTRRVQLTPEGEVFLETCRSAERFLLSGFASLSSQRETMAGALKITASHIFGSFTARLLPDFLRLYPEISVNLIITDEKIDLAEMNVDAAIRIGEAGGADYVTRRLAFLKRCVVGAPDYFALYGIPDQPADLAHHRSIQFVGPSGVPSPWIFIRDGKEFAQPVTPVLTFNRGELMLDAALGGGGVARLFTFMTAEHIKSGQLIAALEPFQPPPVEMNAVMLKGRNRNARLRAFLDFLYRRFEGLGA